MSIALRQILHLQEQQLLAAQDLVYLLNYNFQSLSQTTMCTIGRLLFNTETKFIEDAEMFDITLRLLTNRIPQVSIKI